MSWTEPDNGIGEVQENPDPEEDSDFPQRLLHNEDVNGIGEQEGPEEDCAGANATLGVSAEPQNLADECTNNHAQITAEDATLQSVSADSQVCCTENSSEENINLTGKQNVLPSAGNQNAEGISSMPQTEGDSFEQDDELAAPECENETRQDACSESDRQQFTFQECLPHQSGITASHQTVMSNDSEQERSDFLNPANPKLRANSPSALQDVVGSQQASENLCAFSGDIEISNSLEDAPEAEVCDITQGTSTFPENGEIDTFDQAGSCDLVRVPNSTMETVALEEANMASRNAQNIPNDENTDIVSNDNGDQDLQAPECDREAKHYPAFHENNPENSLQTSVIETVIQEQACCNNVMASQELESLSCINSQTAAGETPGPDSENRIETANFVSSQNGPPSVAGENAAIDSSENSEDVFSSHHQLVNSNSEDQRESDNAQAHQDHPADKSPDHNHSLNPNLTLSSDHSQLVGPKEDGQPDPSETGAHPCSQSNPPASSIFSQPRGVELQSSQTASILSSSETNSGGPVSSANPAHENAAQSCGAVCKPGPSPDSQSSSPGKSQSSSPSKAGASVYSSAVDMGSDFLQRKLAEALQSDDEDDILHELDAELLSRSTKTHSQQKSSQSPKSRTAGKEIPGQAVNGMQPSFDIRQLQEHNRQLLEQLRIRDNEIAKLKQDSDAQKAELLLAQSLVDEMNKKQTPAQDHNPEDLYLPQIKELEKTIAQQQNEIKALKEKLGSHDSAAKRAVTTLQNELKSRVDQVTKMYEECMKEKDMMVVKFAESEAKNMEAKRFAEKSEAKVREAMRDKDNMMNALKAAKADKQRVVVNFEAKCAEIGNVHKELEKLKEALNSSDYRIKWFQNKLKDELESHKETKSNLEKTSIKLKEAREETEIIRKECQAIVKRYQESEEIKSNSLDKELKMKETELRTQMQERNDTEEIHQMTKRELDSLKAQHKDTIEEAKTYKDKVRCLEEERQQNHSMIENYQEIMQRQKTDNAELKAKVTSLSTLEDDYKRAQEMIHNLDKDIAELRVTNRDLQKDMESCRERESKMLTLQSELSRTNALLRSENTNLSNKASTLMGEVEKLKMEVQELETSVNDLRDKYEEEKLKRKEEVEKMGTGLAEKTKECNDFKQKWEDEMDNAKTLKRRHANNVKDLTRQLHQVKKKLESLEGKGDAGSMGSRTNSNGSLNSIENSAAQHPAPVQPPVQEFPVITEQVEVDKQVLIERIVRLQKSHARKNEKLEFLGEHIQQLLEEIKKKNKIIQVYALREEAGTLSSEDMDANKAEAQKEMQTLLARKGGIMASVYSVHQQDGSMTLELSLQINKKLQAVLEDTLLKNITLKENLDTLGEEIARLSQENRQLQLHLQGLEQH